MQFTQSTFWVLPWAVGHSARNMGFSFSSPLCHISLFIIWYTQKISTALHWLLWVYHCNTGLKLEVSSLDSCWRLVSRWLINMQHVFSAWRNADRLQRVKVQNGHIFWEGWNKKVNWRKGLNTHHHAVRFNLLNLLGTLAFLCLFHCPCSEERVRSESVLHYTHWYHIL